jgi:hypothetical protein
MLGIFGAANLKNGTQKNPAIIAAKAPRQVNLDQNKERMRVGQNVAAIPDQPKIIKIILQHTQII